MTVELFALITGQSVLRHSIASDRWDQQVAIVDAPNVTDAYPITLVQ